MTEDPNEYKALLRAKMDSMGLQDWKEQGVWKFLDREVYWNR